jgi:predicted nucleotidyltransferase
VGHLATRILEPRRKGRLSMRTEYYGSVKVTYFEKEKVWKALRELAAKLERSHPEIRRALVFGSLVHDRAVPGSDVDLLLVLDQSELPFLDRPARYRPEGFPVGLDVFAYTTDEIDKMLHEGNFFVKRALAEGVTLFDRDNTAPS